MINLEQKSVAGVDEPQKPKSLALGVEKIPNKKLFLTDSSPTDQDSSLHRNILHALAVDEELNPPLCQSQTQVNSYVGIESHTHTSSTIEFICMASVFMM